MTSLLEDREAIRDLKNAFMWHIDRADPEGLVELFADDAVCDYGPYGTMVGRQSILKGFRRRFRDSEPFEGIHSLTNSRITIDGDTATATWYLLDLVFGPADDNPLKLAGLYDERYRRYEGGWLIEASRLEFLWTSRHGRVTADNPMTTTFEA